MQNQSMDGNSPCEDSNEKTGRVQLSSNPRRKRRKMQKEKSLPESIAPKNSMKKDSIKVVVNRQTQNPDYKIGDKTLQILESNFSRIEKYIDSKNQRAEARFENSVLKLSKSDGNSSDESSDHDKKKAFSIKELSS